MVTKQLVHIPVILVLCQVFYGTATQQCTEAEYSKFGMKLQGHIFKKITGVSLSGLCLVDCYQDVRCQSFNYVISQNMCELNNRTKEARPEDYVPDPDRLYFRRDMNRVPLGSIPELPAETCKEIKASEGGQAVSDKYWFYSIIPGKTVLAHCDMKNEDLDECSASIPVCDVNANCKNTPGSHICSCKAGFTGDGKTCTDVDECSASISVCDINANCQNNAGSYICSCKAGFFGDGKTCRSENVVNKSCATLYKSGQRKSGVYTIKPDGSGTFDVFCDQTTAGGGWTVFQKRQDGSVDFYRGWADYKRGFGNLSGEFWLGLENIHRLTSSGQYKLRVDLEDFAGNTTYAEYGSFAVASEGNKYQLSVGNFSGTAGDSLSIHNGLPFTTKDQDNDRYGGNCAVHGKGAWWYNDCYDSNLNGIYRQGEYDDHTSVNWIKWKKNTLSLKKAEMKIRPVNF